MSVFFEESAAGNDNPVCLEEISKDRLLQSDILASCIIDKSGRKRHSELLPFQGKDTILHRKPVAIHSCFDIHIKEDAWFKAWKEGKTVVIILQQDKMTAHTRHPER